LKGLYVRTDLTNNCDIKTNLNEFCLANVKNNPDPTLQPAFIAWPTNSTQLQATVKFAIQHNLCIMVAGTGHEMLRRHSCKDGMFIRTTFLKDYTWNLTDPRHAEGTIKVGSGTVFAEIQKYASAKGRFIASGWCPTVGVVGFMLGGGHGPFAPSKGLGVDQLIEVEMVNS
jgi:ribonuclease T2